jgi:hypothetical protein
MSAKLTGAVWELDLPRPQKFVLLCLADHAKDDGSDVYPSLARIRYKTGYSETQVRDLMQALVKGRVLVLVARGGKGPGDTAEYQINITAAKAQPAFREWLKTQSPHVQQFPAKGAKTEPMDKGAVSSEEGCGSGSDKGAKTEPELRTTRTKNTRTKPSDADAPDPRHEQVRALIQKLHVETLNVTPAETGWDGRAGKALKTWLAEHPNARLELIEQLVDCHYRSPARLGMLFHEWIPDMLKYQAGPLNQYSTPLLADEKWLREQRLKSEASVGRNTSV